jgi:DNA-directed RNA polymerase specialized sigma24 family protein
MADRTITQESFDRLLLWLDPDRGRAGQRYESIRSKLIGIFASRGAAFPEEMADDCINRVIQKVPELAGAYEGPPEFYFYSVAKMIFLEWTRKERPIEVPFIAESSLEVEQHYACLEKCLDQLTGPNRELVLEYYQQEKKAKIDHRAALAKGLGIAANALRIRAHRIRQVLEKCVLQCVNQQVSMGCQ